MSAEETDPQEPTDVSAPASLGDTEDIDRIDPQPEVTSLDSGTQVRVLPLKSRAFFKMLRIITRGGAQVLGNMRFDFSDPDDFMSQLTGLLIFSIPEGGDEAIDFVNAMVEPAVLSTDKKERLKQRTDLMNELADPELDDLITIIEAVMQREGDDLKALGQRLMAMFKVAMKTNQIEVQEIPVTSEESTDSSEDSPSTSISSLPSTDGATSTSSTSPSEG